MVKREKKEPQYRFAHTLSILFSILLTMCNLDSQIPESSISSKSTSTPMRNLIMPTEHTTQTSSVDTEILIRLKRAQDGDTLAKELGASIIGRISFGDAHFIKIVGSSQSLEMIKSYTEVIDAEYEQYRTSFESPNDTYFSSQYAPQITELESVWEHYTGRGVKVAVIDSGIDTTHEDFGGPGAFAEGFDFGDNAIYGTSQNNDIIGHGTHVAGIIAARKNNSKGIVGVAPEAILIPYKAASNSGSFSSYTISESIKKATKAGAQVINMSLGGTKTTDLEAKAISYALENNVVLVVAVGNDSIELMNYPASYPGVIAVGSSNGRDKVSSFSTRTPALSIVAPGEDIVSLQAGSSTGYVAKSGTSMATPFVSGVVALLKQKFPNASPAQIKKLLENTAKDIEHPGYDILSGYGRVQPKQALATTNLPDVTWKKVEFTITAEHDPIQYYAINFRNVSNAPIYTLFSNVDGKLSTYLPSGTYNFFSSYIGLEYSGSFNVADADVTLTKNFESVEFSGYYRISTYKDADSADTVDTVLSLYKEINGGSSLLASNNNRNTDTYSEITFKPLRGVRYKIVVKSNSSNDAGDYILAVETEVLGAEVREARGDESYDHVSMPDIDITKKYSGSLSNSSEADTYYFKID